ncbi:MAG TPA: sigma-54-dependent Fis family transcriptional regulator, partial [Bacteroidia bacterium]|nr:sigma-54-dependent Fis family transcriptional regulator [Bacteroidia bacterium]
ACVLSSGNEIGPNEIHISSTTDSGSFYNENFTLDDYTKKIINHYLDSYDQNVTGVAKMLGIGKSTIYRYLKDENLEKK